MPGVGFAKLYRYATDAAYRDQWKRGMAPYIPGVAQIQQMADEQQFWRDYEKVTGKTPRYPGRQVHGADLGDIQKGFDWWNPF